MMEELLNKIQLQIVTVPAPQKDAFDLLGLDMSSTTPSFPSPSFPTAASLPRPPSGGPSPNGNGSLVDEVFGAPPPSTNNHTPANDLFA